jgi:hypothetical protein
MPTECLSNRGKGEVSLVMGSWDSPRETISMDYGGRRYVIREKRDMWRRDSSRVGWRSGRYRISDAGGNSGPCDDLEFRFDLERT